MLLRVLFWFARNWLVFLALQDKKSRSPNALFLIKGVSQPSPVGLYIMRKQAWKKWTHYCKFLMLKNNLFDAIFICNVVLQSFTTCFGFCPGAIKSLFLVGFCPFTIRSLSVHYSFTIRFQSKWVILNQLLKPFRWMLLLLECVMFGEWAAFPPEWFLN